jgi:type IX secretion system PorP/SprF family membrane protein
MHKIFTQLTFSFLLLLLSTIGSTQDIHFSQFYETPLYRNPALAGIVSGDIRVQSIYRSQWNSIANAYTTGSLNAEYKMPVAGDDFLTTGVEVFYDKAGSTNLTSTHVLPTLNYHKSISSERNMYLSIGFMGGWVERKIDRSKISTNSSYEGMGDGETRLLPRKTYFDGIAGVSFNTGLNDNPDNNLVLGVAYHHFNKPKNSFFNDETVLVSPKWVYSADVKFGVSDYSAITLHTDYVTQGTYSEAMGGFMYSLKMGGYVDEPDYVVSAGGIIRVGDAVIPVIKLDYKPFSFAFSYDVNTSKLSNTSFGRGGAEMALTYTGFLDRENSTINALKCPRF